MGETPKVGVERKKPFSPQINSTELLASYCIAQGPWLPMLSNLTPLSLWPLTANAGTVECRHMRPTVSESAAGATPTGSPSQTSLEGTCEWL